MPRAAYGRDIKNAGKLVEKSSVQNSSPIGTAMMVIQYSTVHNGSTSLALMFMCLAVYTVCTVGMAYPVRKAIQISAIQHEM